MGFGLVAVTAERPREGVDGMSHGSEVPIVNSPLRWSSTASPGLRGAMAVLGSKLVGVGVAYVLLGGPGSVSGSGVPWALMTGSVTGLIVALTLIARCRHISPVHTLRLLLPSRADFKGMRGPCMALATSLGFVVAVSHMVEFPQAHSPEVYEAALSPVLWVDNILLAPVVEELMLRGFLFDAMRRRAVASAVIVTGGVGAMLHLSFPQVLFVTPMQMILSYVRARTGTVSVCIVLHVGYNLAALVTAFLLASVSGSPLI
ncbi:MAG TPA: hypothetical protein DHW14_08000 [Clostridiales bacterium]|nr:hypothetical protein [Clostridiales bacterium]